MRESGIVVAVYEIDRAYGGAAEGGWWYDTGELVRVLRAFKSSQEEQAHEFCRRVNRSLHFKAEHNNVRSVGSVIYSGGRYAAECHEGTAPESYPESRPHYE